MLRESFYRVVSSQLGDSSIVQKNLKRLLMLLLLLNSYHDTTYSKQEVAQPNIIEMRVLTSFTTKRLYCLQQINMPNIKANTSNRPDQ